MSTKAILGRLHKVDLREAWASESSGFTPWLAQEESLQLLGEAIGIELELESQEKNVGPFRADILCKDTATDNWVLIENQLEKTDHSHLGQLLTYAAGLNAVTIVWIAERFTEEHRAALDWLNEHTDETINCFGLEIELWRIGDSTIAPKFNIISQPNDWSRTVKTAAATGNSDVTEHKQLQMRFWTGFRDYMEREKSFVRCQKPSPKHWASHAIGLSGAHLDSIISGANNAKAAEMRVELCLKGVTAKQEFAILERRSMQIEQSLGFPLTWHNTEAKSCKVYVRTEADFMDEQLWTQHFAWLKRHLEIMHRTFAPIMREVREQAEQA